MTAPPFPGDLRLGARALLVSSLLAALVWVGAPAAGADSTAQSVRGGESVFDFGSASFHGSTGSLELAAPLVDSESVPDGDGYWLLGRDGGVFAYGDAIYAGSTGGMPLVAPVVGMAASSDSGYWLVAADGGVFAYGDAPFLGSAAGLDLAAPIVGMAATSTGEGYWLVAADGGVFAYGDAPFRGSLSGTDLVAPIVAIAAGVDDGYWLLSAEGGVFSYGAPYLGSATGQLAGDLAVDLEPTATGGGYRIATLEGRVLAFGDATVEGEAAGIRQAVIDIESAPGGNGYWLVTSDLAPPGLLPVTVAPECSAVGCVYANVVYESRGNTAFGGGDAGDIDAVTVICVVAPGAQADCSVSN